eukprot:scaffold21393_cov122-Isochrysis_galbana.AAC.1
MAGRQSQPMKCVTAKHLRGCFRPALKRYDRFSANTCITTALLEETLLFLLVLVSSGMQALPRSGSGLVVLAHLFPLAVGRRACLGFSG